MASKAVAFSFGFSAAGACRLLLNSVKMELTAAEGNNFNTLAVITLS